MGFVQWRVLDQNCKGLDGLDWVRLEELWNRQVELVTDARNSLQNGSGRKKRERPSKAKEARVACMKSCKFLEHPPVSLAGDLLREPRP